MGERNDDENNISNMRRERESFSLTLSSSAFFIVIVITKREGKKI
jgi:hypothetical protein